MNIYKKLPLDMKDEIDKQLWKQQKQEIKSNELLHRKLRLLLHELPYHLPYELRKVIDWLCWCVIRPRTYGEGVCGCHTEEGKYIYRIDEKKNPKPLYKKIEKWVYYLETKDNKPYYETLYDAIREAVDDWCSKNITNGFFFQAFALDLGFNIPDMYENYMSNYDIIDYSSETLLPAIFITFVLDIIEELLMMSFHYEIDTDNELTSEEEVDTDNED